MDTESKWPGPVTFPGLGNIDKGGFHTNIKGSVPLDYAAVQGHKINIKEFKAGSQLFLTVRSRVWVGGEKKVQETGWMIDKLLEANIFPDPEKGGVSYIDAPGIKPDPDPARRAKVQAILEHKHVVNDQQFVLYVKGPGSADVEMYEYSVRIQVEGKSARGEKWGPTYVGKQAEQAWMKPLWKTPKGGGAGVPK
jgi:hypothetical protein